MAVWSSQLAAGDFPPVCAMSGRPAQAWRKFYFVTPPRWAYFLLILVCVGGLGIIAYAIVLAAVAERANGYLPLTHSSRNLAVLALFGPLGLICGALLLWGFAVVIAVSSPSNDPTSSFIAGALGFIGAFLMLGGLVGRFVVMPLVCPRGKVQEQQAYQYDKLVELRNVHPVFVAAVNEMHAARAAAQATAAIPTLPGST